MSKNIILCGVGGQGTVLASKILSAASMEKGIKVLSAETIGMSQRGGSVTSFVKIGNDAYTPLIGKGEADIIIGFEAGETVRMLPYLKKDGTVIVNNNVIKPVTASLSGMDYTADSMIQYLKNKTENVKVVDGDRVTMELGSAKVLNMVLLGAAISTGVLDITKDEAVRIMSGLVKEKFISMNEKALRAID
ncbi:MAG: indolepyruvate oxidoreductase subunit beta [Eubacterium sp.]|nr:indolepyruvate oxidoreductase subunit beta [Eubacterium sp.]